MAVAWICNILWYYITVCYRFRYEPYSGIWGTRSPSPCLTCFSLVTLPLLLSLLRVTKRTNLCVILLPKGRQRIQLLLDTRVQIYTAAVFNFFKLLFMYLFFALFKLTVCSTCKPASSMWATMSPLQLLLCLSCQETRHAAERQDGCKHICFHFSHYSSPLTLLCFLSQCPSLALLSALPLSHPCLSAWVFHLSEPGPFSHLTSSQCGHDSTLFCFVHISRFFHFSYLPVHITYTVGCKGLGNLVNSYYFPL